MYWLDYKTSNYALVGSSYATGAILVNLKTRKSTLLNDDNYDNLLQETLSNTINSNYWDYLCAQFESAMKLTDLGFLYKYHAINLWE